MQSGAGDDLSAFRLRQNSAAVPLVTAGAAQAAYSIAAVRYTRLLSGVVSPWPSPVTLIVAGPLSDSPSSESASSAHWPSSSCSKMLISSHTTPAEAFGESVATTSFHDLPAMLLPLTTSSAGRLRATSTTGTSS